MSFTLFPEKCFFVCCIYIIYSTTNFTGKWVTLSYINAQNVFSRKKKFVFGKYVQDKDLNKLQKIFFVDFSFT